MCTLAKKAAEQLQDADSIDYIEKLIVRLQLISQAQKVEKELIARLDASPTDPDANLALGKLYCFQQGNWEKGISMLALGNDADIKPIAEKDLEAPTSAADQLLLADRWWTLAQAQQEPFKGAMLSRAGHWYRSAQPKLTGLLREKAGKRLAQSPPQARSKKTMLFERPGGSFYGCRSACIRPIMLATGGGNDFSERAVTMALVWLANHQLADGSWSLQNFTHRCVDGGRACTGIGQVKADSGATAMGLLPFLAAGQTHKSKGPYTSHIAAGIHWLIKNQQPDGNLAKDAVQPMYSHGLCTIALAEAFGLSNDPKVGKAAQLAVNYILAAQNPADGGWRYHPRDPGDTSVVGWQLMALKSARASGLNVGGTVFQGTSKWLDAAAVNQGSEYAYQPGGGSSPTMTSVGILCREYLGAKRDNPMIAGGTRFLMARLPNMQAPNIYCWYYSTQAMHNVGGKDWDAWNREVRDLLVNRQNRDSGSCAFGSWAPPVPDTWATHGGRVMMTSLAALTLEVYYRYPPLYGE